jgi:phage shock protein PspC (stress-responsive transcriptional regulator)
MTTDQKLLRPRDGVILGGVAAALARAYRLDVTLVRAGFVLLALLFGVGILAYLVLWAALAQEDAV